MKPECRDVESLLAGYALGPAEGEERAAVERHLPGCPECRALLSEYQGVAELLLEAAPPRRPPASLRSRLLNRVGRRERRWPWGGVLRPSRVAGVLGAAAVALILVRAGIALDALSADIVRLRNSQEALTAAAQADRIALAVVSYPSSRSDLVEGDAAYGSLVWEPELRIAVLTVWGLAAPPQGEAYQAWWVRPDGSRVSAGLLSIEGEGPMERFLLRSEERVGNFAGLGVTVEPASGSAQPTGLRILSVEF